MRIATPVEQRTDPLADAIDRVRKALAERHGGEHGEPLVVTAEASASAAESFYVVCQVGQQNYLYLATADGAVELIDSEYEFSDVVGTWHAVQTLGPTTLVSEEPTVPSEPEPDQPAPAETGSTETPPVETPIVETPEDAPESGVVQLPPAHPSETGRVAPADTPANLYFTELGLSPAAANNGRVYRPEIRQQMDATDSLLLVVMQRNTSTPARVNESWHDSSNEDGAEDDEFEFANVDDVFESLLAF